MKVLRFWKLIGSYYISEKKTDTLIIIWIWAPNLMDVDSLRNASILTNAWYDVITPEYYGFCRSEGKFTPTNSIKSLLATKKFFKNWLAINIYSWEEIKVSYKKFIYLGMSYGWWVAPLLPKFDKEVKTIAMFYPVTDYSTFWKRGVKEETVDDFLSSIKRGFSKIYNGINLPIWKKHFEDKTDLIPVKNIKYLKDVNVFLAHGTDDISIYYKKTREYYEKLKLCNKKGNYLYKEYKWLWHGFDTMERASYDMIKWLQEVDKKC